jgi:hypothetical protein
MLHRTNGSVLLATDDFDRIVRQMIDEEVNSLRHSIVVIGNFLLTHFEGAASAEVRAEEFRKIVATLSESGIYIVGNKDDDA